MDRRDEFAEIEKRLRTAVQFGSIFISMNDGSVILAEIDRLRAALEEKYPVSVLTMPELSDEDVERVKAAWKEYCERPLITAPDHGTWLQIEPMSLGEHRSHPEDMPEVSFNAIKLLETFRSNAPSIPAGIVSENRQGPVSGWPEHLREQAAVLVSKGIGRMDGDYYVAVPCRPSPMPVGSGVRAADGKCPHGQECFCFRCAEESKGK